MQPHALRLHLRPFCLVALLIAFILPAVTLNATRAAAPEWTVVWSDEFDGSAGSQADSAKWAYDIGGNGWGNNELETYTSRTENSQLDGEGHLLIKVDKETLAGPDGITRNYTSARMLTKGKFEQRYGRFETRVKLPFGQGIWPAFWMLGNDIDAAGWPQCGEIDVMENVGREPGTNHGSLHGPGYSGGSALSGIFTLADSQRFADDFHAFAIEWEPNAVRFYVDDTLYETRTPGDAAQRGRWVFDHPFFLILNVAVGGNFPGNPDANTVFPQTMTVDYVRVYADAATIPRITSVVAEKKNLIVTGENFGDDASILADGEKRKTLKDESNPSVLIGKKLAKQIESGQTVRIQVRNANLVSSAVYSYTKP
ncbi:MAG TPA: glycoside hydrolase family 16 protein [Blastocatellia bacterium]|nr:glycoside hydrolase family 16 protein [Blastocatellia bacterium]